MIIITRTNAIYSSPRIEKYIEYFEHTRINYLAVGWDRTGENLKRNKTIYFTKKSGYNVGGIKAAFNRFIWMYFLLRIFFKYKNETTTIHAFDLDTAFPACLYKILFKKEVNVIFDICDWFSATLYNQNKIILYIFKKMEKFTIKYSNEVIIPEPERIEQIPYTLNKKELVVPNIPSFGSLKFLFKDENFKFHNGKITVSYVGGFFNDRLLSGLLSITKKGLINLLIAGYGSEEIEEQCVELSILPNVKHYGKVDYKVGLNIMYNSDIIYAMYSKKNPNHLYAAPNKYYESMLLGKPIISTKGISLSDKIVANDIGYVIDENLIDLENLIIGLDRNDLSLKGEKALSLWNKKYKNYILNFLNDTYSRIIGFKN